MPEMLIVVVMGGATVFLSSQELLNLYFLQALTSLQWEQ
jgi:hypothetical protein